MIPRLCLCAFCSAIVHESTLNRASECVDVGRCAERAYDNGEITDVERDRIVSAWLRLTDSLAGVRRDRERRRRANIRLVKPSS